MTTKVKTMIHRFTSFMYTMAEITSEEKVSNEIIDKVTKFSQDGCGCALGEKF